MNSADNPLLRPRNPFERRVVQAVAAAKPARSVGIIEKPLPGGVSLQNVQRTNRGAGGTIHPFYIYGSGLMHAGTVSGVIPIYEGSPIGEDGEAITLTGNFYVYIKAEFDLVFGAHFFLDSATRIAAEPITIVTNATPLSDVLDLPGLTFTTYRLVAQVVGGDVVREQNTKTMMNLSICDASNGTEEGRNVSATWSPA